MKRIAYYITAHGYGHGARASDIINALCRAAPEIAITVITDLPTDFLRSRIPAHIDLRPGAFDVGLIQKDSIRVDLEASLRALLALYAREEELIRQEAEFMRSEEIGVVVADIPAIPLAAARRAGIPAVATSNFGWDWIYAEFAEHDVRWQPIVDKFRKEYEQTDLLLRQPFAESMKAFPRQIDLPLLAEPGMNRRPRIAEITGADPGKRWVLLSFTSLNLDEAALKQLDTLQDCVLFSVDPLHWPESTVHCISRSEVCFADIMASVDVVVTKPGFGILSECIANNRPIIYTDRSHFREYPVLVESIKKYCRYAFVPNSDLYAGRLQQALEAVDSATEPRETIARGGAALAAGEILARCKPAAGRRNLDELHP